MYPLAVCSVLAVAVFLERIWSLRKARILPPRLTDDVLSCLNEGRTDRARQLCDGCADSPLARIARAGLLHVGAGPDTIRFIVSEVGGQENADLERFQRVLSTIAHLAPLLGLLGTVSGMIRAFDTISAHSMGDPGLIAGGISEALITTAAGLVVAIPVVVMHKVVQSRAARRSLELEREAVRLTECLMQCTPGFDRKTTAVRQAETESGSGTESNEVYPNAQPALEQA